MIFLLHYLGCIMPDFPPSIQHDLLPLPALTILTNVDLGVRIGVGVDFWLTNFFPFMMEDLPPLMSSQVLEMSGCLPVEEDDVLRLCFSLSRGEERLDALAFLKSQWSIQLARRIFSCVI